MMKALLALLASATAVAATMTPVAAARAGSHPARIWHVFASSAAMPSLSNPRGIAVDPAGNVYVADAGHAQIQKLSPSGERLAVFGSYGWMPGHFRDPTGVAVDRWGNIFVADAQNYRIQKLSPDGRPLAVFPLRSGYWSPSIAVDSEGEIYLSSYDRIQKLSSRGALLSTRRGYWGPLAIDRRGNVYAARSTCVYDRVDQEWYHVIYQLSPRREILAEWSCSLGYPAGITVDSQGYVYVIASYPARIIKLSPAGEVLRVWGGPGHGLLQAAGVTVDAADNVYVADGANQHVYKLSPRGRLLATWGIRGNAPGRYSLPSSVAVDRQGNVYVADTFNDRVQNLSSSGEPLLQWGTHGRAPGQFNQPTGVLVNRQGNVVVADYGNNRLQTFSPAGKLLGVVRLPGPRRAGYYYPGYYYPGYFPQAGMSLALDSKGNLVIADSAYDRVYKVSPGGRILASYSDWATARDSTPGGVAVDRADDIYVADFAAARIVKLSPSGRRLAAWGSFGYIRAGEFNRPRGLAIDAQGNVYVSDVGNHSIQKLSPAGRPLRVWGTLGSKPGQFADPLGIGIGPGGTVYVADTGNDRVQRLIP